MTTLTLTNAIWPKRAPHDLKKTFCTIFMKSALFSFFGVNLTPVWRFWELWRSKMRFGENVLRMTWKERLYNFNEKRTVFPFWREFEASVTIFRSLTLKNAIWPKRAAHDLKRSVLYNFHGKRTVFPFWREFQASVTILTTLTLKKCNLAKTCCAWPKKTVLYNFHGKCTVFPYWRKFKTSVTILRSLTLTNAIWPKRAAHDLKRAFCTIFIKSARFSLFGENWRPVWLWQLWHWKMRFGKNVFRMTWKERFVQFSWKAHGFLFLERIWGQCDDYDNFDAHKCDLPKTCSAWPKKNVLYNFHEKRIVFLFWSEFDASVTLLRTLKLKNAIWPKRAAHDLKRTFEQF